MEYIQIYKNATKSEHGHGVKNIVAQFLWVAITNFMDVLHLAV